MTQSLMQYGELLQQLKPLLPEYLRLHGREPNKKGYFQCINPQHEDSNPSCHLIAPDNQYYKCFACGAKGDIFNAANLLEGRPLVGTEFLQDNVFAVADQFSIKHENIKLENKVQKAGEIYRAYDLAAAILGFSDNEEPMAALYDGWTLQAIREVEPDVGTIAWEDFSKKMREFGDYTQVYLETIGINSKLFDDHLLTFGIRNSQGRVVGFAARTTKTGNRVAKWRNTRNEVPIFDKGSMLYGLHVAKGPGPLYLVEGYSDVIELRLRGLKNVAAYMSSAITPTQVDTLQSIGKKDLILCPDWDKNGAGMEAITRALDDDLLKRKEFTLRIKELPDKEGYKNYDPQEYVAEHGLDAFLALEEQEAFEWRLGRVDEKLDPEHVCKTVFPIIVAETDPLRRESMLRKLAVRSGERLKALQEALDIELEKHKSKTRHLAQSQVQKLRLSLEHASVEAVPELLRKTAIQIEEVQDVRYKEGVHGPRETLSFMRDLRREFDNRGSSLPGWSTGYAEIDKALGGFPRKECMVSLAGDGNVGKSAICQNVGLKIAQNHSDVCVLLFSIDDTRSQVIPRLLAQMTGIPINDITQPGGGNMTESQLARLREAYGTLEELIAQGRFDIKDASHSASMAFADGWIDATRNQHPDRQILFILDNFHRLRGLSGTGERERLEQASDAVFMLTKQKGITALCTMELRKREYPNKRPRIEDLKGSKRFEYDNSVIIMLHNPMHVDQANPNSAHWMEDGVSKPIVEMHFDKNKVTSFKGRVNVRFRPETSQILDHYDKTQAVRTSPAFIPE